MYKDIVAKIEVHKQKIIDGFIKQGIYPTDKMIEERLQSIETSLSFLKPTTMVQGEIFNVEVYNNMLQSVYKDLELLYQLLYEISIKEYFTLKAFVDTHLDELEDYATKYEKRAELEANSTSLGKSILFKNSGFDLFSENNINLIDLGAISVNKGSRISCFLNANNIESDQVVFGFKKGTEAPIYVAPYNYNQDMLLIPGDVNKKVYEIKIDDDKVLSDKTEMILKDSAINLKNQYVILGGKDKILVKKFAEQSSQLILESPISSEMTVFDSHSYIDFYVIGGNKISFRFNKKPKNTNFVSENYAISNLDYIHHFFIECEEGFAFSFELDGGEVFAAKETGKIIDKKLFFVRDIDIRDFKVVEYSLGDPETYSAFIKIMNDTGDPIDVESVCIKELTAGGVS